MVLGRLVRLGVPGVPVPSLVREGRSGPRPGCEWYRNVVSVAVRTSASCDGVQNSVCHVNRECPSKGRLVTTP